MEIELKRIVQALLKKWIIIVLSVTILSAGAFLYSYFYVTPIYEAYVTIYVQNSRDYEGQISYDSLASSKELIGTCIALLKSNTIMNQVAEDVNLGYDSQQLIKMISATGIESTGILRVAVYNQNPYYAQEIANTIAEIAPAEIVRVITAGNVAVIDKAMFPEEPYSPHIMLNTMIGAIFGLILSCLIIIILELSDTRIKSEFDLAESTTMPVIGVIPTIKPNKR